MKEIAPGVWQLRGFPPNAINVYWSDGILFDAGTRFSFHRIVRQLEDRPVRVVALTHCHPDHQGSAAAVCERYGAGLACHTGDVAAMEGREPMHPRTRMIEISSSLFAGPPRSVDRVLHDGDEVGAFRVIHLPGHTPGQVSFVRAADGTVISGDVVNHMNVLTGMPGLHEPPRFFSADSRENRRSIRRLAALAHRLLCPGHGPPLADAEALRQWTERLPAE